MMRSKQMQAELPEAEVVHDPSIVSKNEAKEEVDEVKRTAFLEYSRKSKLPPIESESWHDSSILIPSLRCKDTTYYSLARPTLSHQSSESADTPSKSLSFLPTDGSVVHISNPLFDGKIITRIRGECQQTSPYFQNRTRAYNWIVQGRFRKRTSFEDVITGQEFDRAFRNRPSSQIVQRMLNMLRSKLPDSFECDFLSDNPFFHHPLLAGCQNFRIDRATEVVLGSEEILGLGDDGNVIEDTSLLNDSEIPKDGAGRRKFFSRSNNLSRFYFEPEEFIYTFDFYSNFFMPLKYSLELGPLSLDLLPYFNGYPLFLSMAKDKNNGEFLWATEIWHKRLLNYDEESPGGRLSRFLSFNAR